MSWRRCTGPTDSGPSRTADSCSCPYSGTGCSYSGPNGNHFSDQTRFPTGPDRRTGSHRSGKSRWGERIFNRSAG
jgi:hypothetical protein